MARHKYLTNGIGYRGSGMQFAIYQRSMNKHFILVAAVLAIMFTAAADGLLTNQWMIGNEMAVSPAEIEGTTAPSISWQHVQVRLLSTSGGAIQLTNNIKEVKGSIDPYPPPRDLALYLCSTNTEVINVAYARFMHTTELVDNSSSLFQNRLSFVRLEALACLRQIVNPDSVAIGLVIPLLRDPDMRVQLAAGYTLQTLTGAPIRWNQTEEWEKWWDQNKFAYALLDRSKILQFAPRTGDDYHNRGCVNYDLNFLTNALTDFRKSCQLGSKVTDYSRCRIWLIRSRLGEENAATEELAKYLAQRAGNPDDWSAKIAQFFVGQITETDLLNAATIPGAETLAGQRCEAYFYIASKYSIEGDKMTAIQDFKRCFATDCPNYEEYQSARAELSYLSLSKTNATILNPGGDGLHLYIDPGDGQSHGWGDIGGYNGSVYHGSFYLGHGWNFSGMAQTNRVAIWYSSNKAKIVAMVLNNGPIYATPNGGLTWKIYRLPGHYRFRITGDEIDGGFVVTGTILPEPQAELIDSSDKNIPDTKINSSKQDWYAVTVAPNGDKLILSSLYSPTLSIAQSGTSVIVSWPASFTGFVLQENPDITTINWTDVTNSVDIVGDENQVTISRSDANNFFRLRSAK
jgi:hypothetical protein